MTVAPARLYPLVLGQANPRDRSEQEIQDYRRALNEIHSDYTALSITPATLQRLHALCQSASGDAGQFKRVDNDIVEFLPGTGPSGAVPLREGRGNPGGCRRNSASITSMPSIKRIFRRSSPSPPSSWISFASTLSGTANGRVSRLLTLLALYQHGYEVGRYISLERLIEESRESYYGMPPAQFTALARRQTRTERLGSISSSRLSAVLTSNWRNALVRSRPHGVPSLSGYSPPSAPNRVNSA